MIEINAGGIIIIFGKKCNLNCHYCLEKPSGKFKDYVYNPSIIDYLNSDFVKPYISDRKIYLLMYGGEPLLYIDDIKHFVSNINKDKFQINMTSNGLLLTDEIVDFLNSNNMKLNISWDGENSSNPLSRGYDVLKDKWDTLLKVNNIQFSSCLTNQSSVKERFNIINKFNNDYKNIHGYTIRFDFDNLKITYNYIFNNFDKVRTEIEELIELYKTGTLEDGDIRKQFIESSFKFYPQNISSYACSLNKTSFRLNVEGNFELCEYDENGMPKFCGNFTDENKPFKTYLNKTFIECYKCSVKSLCRQCACPVGGKDEYIESYCNMMRAICEPILKLIQSHEK